MKRIIFLFVVILSSISSMAQEGENLSCVCCNSSLKDLLDGKVIEKLYVDCGSSGQDAMATSFLMPSGQAPVVAKPLPGDAPDYSKLEAWTCTYSPGKTTDRDIKTAWVEGKPDYGIGEILLVGCLNFKRPVQIWSGYGKSATLFTQNSRPKKVKLTIIQAGHPEPTQYGTWYQNLKVIEQVEVELQDINQFQSLPIPSFDVVSYYREQSDAETVDYEYFLGIQILDVFKGTKWTDTCISEIKNGASTPEEIGAVVFEAFKAYNFDMLECVIPSMKQLAEKAAQYGSPMSAADLKNAEAMYDMVKTNHKDKCKELVLKIGNQGNGIDMMYSRMEPVTKTEKEHTTKDGKMIKMTSISIPVVSNNKKVTLVLNKLFQLQGTWYVTPGEIELVQ